MKKLVVIKVKNPNTTYLKYIVYCERASNHKNLKTIFTSLLFVKPIQSYKNVIRFLHNFELKFNNNIIRLKH